MCLDLGKCKDGKCVPFCEREQQLESCACNGEHVSPPRPVSARPRPSTWGPDSVSYSLLLRMGRAQCRQGRAGGVWRQTSGFRSWLRCLKTSPLASLLPRFQTTWPVWGE